MTDVQATIRLQTWLSPAFPTGAFSYSHGLEQAIADQIIFDQDSLVNWLSNLIQHGAGWNDAVILAESWRLSVANDAFSDIVALATAMCISKERYLETISQGSAFVTAAFAWGKIPSFPEDCPLPIAVGAIAGYHNIDLETTLAAFLHAYISNQVQAALRLMKLGQTNALNVQKQLEPALLDVARRAALATEDDLGSASIGAEIAAMKHETLSPRIFRS